MWTVAPDREQSAVSHSLTLHRPLLVEEVMDKVYAVNGTPTDCVNVAVHGILPGRPDLVVSGINKGANLGDDVTYSGTVSAALEAAIMGIPSFAISMVAREDFLFQTAADYAATARGAGDKGRPEEGHALKRQRPEPHAGGDKRRAHHPAGKARIHRLRPCAHRPQGEEILLDRRRDGELD